MYTEGAKKTTSLAACRAACIELGHERFGEGVVTHFAVQGYRATAANLGSCWCGSAA